MKDALEVPGDFDMILQNAEGIKKKQISLTQWSKTMRFSRSCKLCRCDK
jgi:hypothetical protein